MTLSRTSTSLLKGLGILLIILHNYTHWLPLCVAENEYTFAVRNINQLVQYLGQGGPHVLLNLFSHFGHYGVAIFLFVSGYGLVKKYEDSPAQSMPTARKENILLFLWRHAVKLWRLMIPALLLFVVIEMTLGEWNRPLSRLLPLLGFYSNLQPHRDLILGPWWWFGLMMQFYILWRLIIYRRGKAVLYTMIIACLTIQIAAAWLESGRLAHHGTVSEYLHYNFLPSMLAFGLGVAHARYGLAWLRQWWSPLVGLALIVVGSFNAGIWCLSSAGAVMVALAFVDCKPEADANGVHYIGFSTLLVFFGKISAWLFALHPIVRAFAIRLVRKSSDASVYLSVGVYLAVCIAAACLFTFVFDKISISWHNKK